MLGVSAETVRRWARQGRLGVLQPTGEFQVNLAELQAWARDQGLRLQEPSSSSASVAASRAQSLPPLCAALARGRILSGVAGSTLEEVLHALVVAAPLVDAADRNALLKQLKEREAMASTGLGSGVALPHPRSPSAAFVREPIVIIATLAKPVDWRALDGKPVHSVILLVSPTPQQHLQVLSRIAFLLREPRFLGALERRAAADEISALAAQFEPAA